MSPTPQLRIVGLGHLEGPVREGSVDPSRGSAQDQDSQVTSNGLDIQKTGFFADWKDCPTENKVKCFGEI